MSFEKGLTTTGEGEIAKKPLIGNTDLFAAMSEAFHALLKEQDLCGRMLTSVPCSRSSMPELQQNQNDLNKALNI